MPEGYRPLPVKTDGLKAYQSFFAGTDHEACEEGSGETSIVEALNTKWRQWQSSLVRRSCGVWVRIEQDISQWLSKQTGQEPT